MCQAVKFALGETGVSQRELARRIGVKGPVVNRYCTGERIPSSEIVVEIAVALDIEPNWIFDIFVEIVNGEFSAAA